MSIVKAFIKISILAATLFLTGCATTHQQGDVNDPFESYNRVMHSINNTVDNTVLKPVAQGYDTFAPSPVRIGISNFFSNLNEITIVVNDILQFKLNQALNDTTRFALNSTIGIVGLMDVATDLGYKKHNEDFGQTFGKWGIAPGPYFVLPVFGPKNIRDTIGFVGDLYTYPITHLKHSKARFYWGTAWLIDARANFLKAEKVLDSAAFDEYAYTRDAYLQRRQNLIYDGNPPEEEFDVFSD
ncbi:MAG: phospholipid-binding lipoprotein MlaA [Methylophagaceae bacterium]